VCRPFLLYAGTSSTLIQRRFSTRRRSQLASPVWSPQRKTLLAAWVVVSVRPNMPGWRARKYVMTPIPKIRYIEYQSSYRLNPIRPREPQQAEHNQQQGPESACERVGRHGRSPGRARNSTMPPSGAIARSDCQEQEFQEQDRQVWIARSRAARCGLPVWVSRRDTAAPEARGVTNCQAQ